MHWASHYFESIRVSTSYFRMIINFSIPQIIWLLFLFLMGDCGGKGRVSYNLYFLQPERLNFFFLPPAFFFSPFFKRKHIDISRVITTPESRAKKNGETDFPNLQSPEGQSDAKKAETWTIRAGIGADTDLHRHPALSRHLHKCELCLPNLASQLTCPAGENSIISLISLLPLAWHINIKNICAQIKDFLKHFCFYCR